MTRHEGRIGSKLVGGCDCDVAVAAQEIDSAAAWIEEQTAPHRLERMQANFKRSDDAEVSASAANGPEQVFILRRAHRYVGTVGADDVGGYHVVATQSMLADEPADATAEGQPADTGGRDDAAGCGELVALSLAVECSPFGATLRDRSLSGGVHLNAVHERKIDHENAVGHGLAGNAMAGSAHGDGKLLFAGKADYLHDISNAGGLND